MLPRRGWRRQGRGEGEVLVLARGTACGHPRLLAPGGGTEVAWGEWAWLFPSRAEGEQTPTRLSILACTPAGPAS